MSDELIAADKRMTVLEEDGRRLEDENCRRYPDNYRLVPAGMVAVPVDDLRRVVFLARGGYGDELSNDAISAIERLESIVNGR